MVKAPREEAGREGEERGKGEDKACEDDLGSSRMPLIPMLRGGRDFGVGVLEISASAEKGEAFGVTTASRDLVLRSTVRSEGWEVLGGRAMAEMLRRDGEAASRLSTGAARGAEGAPAR